MKNQSQDTKDHALDPAPAEEDLWFLPGPEPEEADPLGAPLPRPSCGTLFDLADWRAAEAALAQPLAGLSLDLGRLVERAAGFGPPVAERLAQAEAAALSWWTGDRIAPDRIALWLALRIGATGSDGAALIRTAWAARRLAAPGPAGWGGAGAIAAHLGLDGGRWTSGRRISAISRRRCWVPGSGSASRRRRQASCRWR